MLTRSQYKRVLMCDTSTASNMESERLDVAEGTIATDAINEGVNTAEVPPQHVEAVVINDNVSRDNDYLGDSVVSINEVADVSRTTSGQNQTMSNSSDDMFSKMFDMMNQMSQNIIDRQSQETRAMRQDIEQQIQKIEAKLDRQEAKLTAQTELGNKQFALLSAKFDKLSEQTTKEVENLRVETTERMSNLETQLRAEISSNNTKLCEVVQRSEESEKSITGLTETVTQTKIMAEEAKSVAASAKNEACELHTMLQESIKRIDTVEKTLHENLREDRGNNIQCSSRAEVANERGGGSTHVTVPSDNCVRLVRARDATYAGSDSGNNSCHTETGVVPSESTNAVVRPEMQIDTHFEVEQFLKIKRFQMYRDDGNTMHPKTWISQFDICLPPSWPLINQLDFILGFMQGAIGDTMREFAAHCQTYPEFKREFLRITWSAEKQERIKYELILSKPFSESGHRSPVTFFDEMLNKNRFLDNPCTTGELLRHCCGKLPVSYRQLLVGKCDVDINTFRNTLFELEVALGSNTDSHNKRNSNVPDRNGNGNFEMRDSRQWGRQNARYENRQRGNVGAFRREERGGNDRWENRRGDGRPPNNNSWGQPRRNDPNRFNEDEQITGQNEDRDEIVEIRGPNPGRSRQ